MLNKQIEVLIIEDSQTQALRLQLILENQGYHVIVADNGLEGINLLKEHLPPIVITDWIMPEMNGVEFCRTVRKQQFDSYVYIILVTAKDLVDDILTGLNAGADDYLIKPVNPSELLARLNTAKRIINLEQRLNRLMVTDPLTGVFNRRYMNEKLSSEIKRATRYNRPLSVIMCDIDNFKRINDQYGHLAGDKVLESLGQCLVNSIREELDWVSRYGGEEFVIVLPETPLSGALTVAEKIRLEISDTAILFNSEFLRATASFGVASLSTPVKDLQVNTEKVIRLADQCLYQAKEKGRNCCVGEQL